MDSGGKAGMLQNDHELDYSNEACASSAPASGISAAGAR
jgi:hypothetical protein